MNKNYVVILLFSEDYKKLLMVKRKKKPYINMWNGIGGKIEENETEVDAAIRECMEETGIKLYNPKLLVTNIYPKSNPVNSGIRLNVLYDFVKEVDVLENDEGIYEWKPVSFAQNFNSQEIAGCSNIAQFIKEIFDIEGIDKFYK